jgi:hypothetical protein
MDNLPRAIVIAAIILGGAFIIRGLYPTDRFTMVASQGGAFRIDRLTGSVLFCDPLVCRALPLASFAPTPGRATPPAGPPAGATGT